MMEDEVAVFGRSPKVLRSPPIADDLMVVDPTFLAPTTRQRKTSSNLEASGSRHSSIENLSIKSTGNVPKRRRTVEDDVDAEEVDPLQEADRVWANLKAIGDKLRRFVLSDTNKILKTASDFILARAAEYEEVAREAINKRDKLVGRLEGQVVELRRFTMGDQTPKPSFAAVVARNSVPGPSNNVPQVISSRPSVSAPVRKKTYPVLIRSTEEGTPSEDVKAKLFKEVATDRSLNIRAVAIRKIRDGVVMELPSAGDKEQLLNYPKFANLALKADTPRVLGPKVVIYDVPSALDKETLLTELYQKNLQGVVSVSEDDFLAGARILSRGGSREVANVVVELPSKAIRDVVCRQGRIYLGWFCLRVRETDNVMRCFRCYGFGHLAASCQRKQNTCRVCGEEGHLAATCTKEVSCNNCAERKRKADHGIMDPACPTYIEMAFRMRSRIRSDG